MNTEADPKETRRKRLPIIPELHRQAIDDYLAYWIERIQDSHDQLNDAALLAMDQHSAGQLQHWKKYLQCMRWLRSMNEGRRKRGKTD